MVWCVLARTGQLNRTGKESLTRVSPLSSAVVLCGLLEVRHSCRHSSVWCVGGEVYRRRDGGEVEEVVEEAMEEGDRRMRKEERKEGYRKKIEI